ncbi:glycosyltransferase [Arthrobacter sp. 260]|uniref:glycosyltransferase n=1 Tax=Arthrobacter sp. 260 TaxID=2735314 RepID=UPI001490C719|nr:glycosyltransferase [Arthrobacter sp. 260]
MSGLQLPGAVTVVVPARNEEESLPPCLAAITTAAQVLAATYPSIDLTVTVVLDGCTDGSAGVVADYPLAQSLEVDFASVGLARRAGIGYALSRLARPMEEVWVANTDADTVVPADWLVEQCRLAGQGVQLVLGTVVPDPVGLDSERARAWHQAHPLDDGHSYVHGANLGFRADGYLAVGEFAALQVHEDADLTDRLKAHGITWAAVDSIRATTSARMLGRTPGGFAGYLRELPLTGRGAAG